jgi:hypothetical protein
MVMPWIAVLRDREGKREKERERERKREIEKGRELAKVKFKIINVNRKWENLSKCCTTF